MNHLVASWGNYPNFSQTAHTLSWRCELAELYQQSTVSFGSTLAYGNGRSYGDSCLALSDHVIAMRGLNRFINVDWLLGIIRAEAGVTLAEVLELIIPHGWFLAVTPGTQFITLGGAVANDVHGKNHHRRGTFGNHVLQFGLLRQNEPEITCSKLENLALFQATIGGLGLTGIITWVEIQLIPIKASKIDSKVVRFNNLDEFFTLSAELDSLHEYSVAWVDCIATGNKTGRGVFMAGDYAEDGELAYSQPKKLQVPIKLPCSLVNSLSLKAFNAIYWRKHPKSIKSVRIDYYPFFYPLDNILYWNRIYGYKGFQQYQCVIPKRVSEQAIRALLSTIAQQGIGSFLAVLKCCGAISSPGLMSFPMEGTTLALDFPQSKALAKVLFPRLDAIVREAGGRLYAAKDAHMQADDFKQAYPAWEQLEALRDRGLNSHFWKRVTS